MNFGANLLRYANSLNISSQKELAKRVQENEKTISSYITEKSYPTYKKLIKLCKILKCDPNTLMRGDFESVVDEFTQQEQEILSAYRDLSDSDRRIVDFILGIGEHISSNIVTFPEAESNATNVFVCPQKASAGIGKIKDESNPDLRFICFENGIVPPGTTHGVIIDGHSMEDKFFDKQIVFIQNGLECAPSDYGIFSVTDYEDTKIYCKQLMQREDGSKYLHSVNIEEGDPDIDYQNVIDIHCVGRILK